MDRVTMTENELMEALREALAQPEAPDAYTMQELCRIVPRSEDWIRNRLRALVAAGRVEPVRVPRANMFGAVAPTCAYRFKRAA